MEYQCFLGEKTNLGVITSESHTFPSQLQAMFGIAARNDYLDRAGLIWCLILVKSNHSSYILINCVMNKYINLIIKVFILTLR